MTMNKYIEYDGYTWYFALGYYRKTFGTRRGEQRTVLLHRYIWEKNYGKIPKGYLLHHKDKNTINNDLSNLELISRGKHITLHHTGKTVSKITRERLRIANINYLLTHKHNSLGRKNTPESLEKMRLAKLGKKASEETKLKMSKSQKLRWLRENSKLQ